MKLLAVDTSFEACSAAITVDGSPLWATTRLIGRGHAEILPVMVAEGFQASGLAPLDLDRIGVVIGPGTFAGLRVGLAFARGLALGGRARVIGVTSLAALAASLGQGRTIASVVDARRGQIYAALFDKDLSVRLAPFVAAPAQAAASILAAATGPFMVTGSGAAIVAPFLSAAADHSAQRRIDPLAVARLAAAATAIDAPASPLYLRPPDAAPGAPSIFSEAREE